MANKSTLKIFFRQLGRNRRTFVINLIGLSIGLACSFIILLFVIGEAGYERFQENRDQVYRVVNDDPTDELDIVRAINYSSLSEAILNEIPEIENTSILEPRIDRPYYVLSDDEYIVEKGSIYEVEPGYFDIFTVPLTTGQQSEPLKGPDQILISKEKKIKYYGDGGAIGKSLTLIIDESEKTYTVAGIMERLPGKTSFSPDFIIPFDVVKNANLMGWKYIAFELFIKVREGSNIQEVENKITQVSKKYKDDDSKVYLLQSMTDFHLDSDQVYGSHLLKGNKTSIVIFSIIALVILLIASINYILLSTAESSMRFKEIGIRKVSGARRFNLILQLQIEALVKVFLALPIALFLVERTKSVVDSFFGLELLPSYSHNGTYVFGFILITILVGLISGLYISIKLSKLQTTELISGNRINGRRRTIGRKLLIGFQLLMFIVLFSGMMVMRNQVRHALSLNADLKIDKIFEISNSYSEIQNIPLFRTKLEAFPGIVSVSSAFTSLLDRNRWANMAKSPKDPENEIIVEQYFVDHNYVETVGIEYLYGRPFNEQSSATGNEIIVNQKMISQLKFENPIGEIIETKTMFNSIVKEYTIVGVVKNFVAGSAHNEIGPLIIFPRQSFVPARQILIQTGKGMNNELYSHISDVYAELSSDKPLTMISLSDKLDQLYSKDYLLTRIISIIAYLAIFISCLGLFGLSLFVARSKNKEIGIRKVFGAGKAQIIKLIVKDFVPIVIIANAVAIPFTIIIMRQWLNEFAYKVSISPWIFILALLISSLIVGLTLLANAHIASGTDPVKTLRQE